MKGFTDGVDGPLGPWFKKVHEAVGVVQVGDSRERVIECLGPPDEVQHDAVRAGGQLQGLLESVAGGDTLIRYGDKSPLPETLVYRDPFRPRRCYLLGIRAGVVHTAWQETASSSPGSS
jgi:hypothetical protein